MDFLTLAEQRFSVRDFDPKPVEQEKIDKILHAGKVAPTALNQQPQKVFIATKPETIKKLNEISSCIYGASTVIIMGYDKTRIWVHPKHPDVHSGYVDSSICLTHMMLEAQQLGLGTCWVARFDPYTINEILGIDKNIVVTALMPIGYPRNGALPSERHSTFRTDADWISII